MTGALAILATWLLAAGGLVGLGLLLTPLARFGGISLERLGVDFWLGFACASTFLMLWHLALPVRGGAAWVLAAAGAAGWLRARAPVANYLGSRPWEGSERWLAFALLLGLWIAHRATGPSTHHDAGSYHVPALLWWKTHALPPGIANLHDRLGFNNASLLFSALLDQGPWERRAEHVGNGLLIFVFAAHLVHRALGLRKGWVAPPLAAFDLLLAAPVVVFMLRSDMVSSLMLAVPLSLVLFRASSLVHELASGRGTPSARDRHHALAACALFAFAPTIKLSGGVLAALGGLGTLVVLLRRSTAPSSRRVASVGVALAAVVLGLWMTRGVIASGYPLYPSTWAAAPVAWRVSPAQADAQRAWIAHSARLFHSAEWRNRGPIELGPPWRGSWFRSWAGEVWDGMKGSRWFVVQPAALALLFALLRLSGRGRDPVGASLWLAGAAAVSTVFWILTAPRPRFGLFSLWILAASLGAPVVAGWLRARGRATVVAATAALVMLGSLPAVRALLAGSAPEATGLWVRPPRRGHFHERPTPEVAPVTTARGLALVVPVQDNRCFDVALLCTPHPSPGLELRRPGDPAGGFRIDGPWQPASWPNPGSGFVDRWRPQPTPRAGRESQG